MTCAELCCWINWGHIPQLCAKFEPWRGHLSNMVMTSAYPLIKWCILNVPFCSIFVPFQFYLVMILVADNILRFFGFPNWLEMVQRNLFFWILVPLRGEGGGGFMRGWVWVRFIICVEFTLYNTKSTKNSVFFHRNIDLHRAMLPNYLGTYSSAFCQIWALQKAVEERNKCQSSPKS